MYQDNTSKPNEPNDYGIKIAKAGFDATTAQNVDLLFDSSWTSMQIYAVIKCSDYPNGIYPHKLRFPPIAVLMGGDSLAFSMQPCNVDDTNVYFGSLDLIFGDFVLPTGYIVIYNVDISEDVDYPYTDRPSINVAYDQDYGIKVPKLGASSDSKDMRDFILHSRCGSPMVLAVKTERTSPDANKTTVSTFPSTIVQYTSRVGYRCLVFGYVGLKEGSIDTTWDIPYSKKAYQHAPQQGQAFPVTYTFNDGKSYVQAIASTGYENRASLVVLRSPMFTTTNEVTVDYI